MKKLNLAIIGYGKGGQLFNGRIAATTGYFEVSKILTTNAEKVKNAEKDYPKAAVVSTYEEILKDPEVQVINISIPNHLHKNFAERALKAGKHVVVEKPFTTTVKEAEELISLAREKSKILSVNHNRRWDSDFQTVKKVIGSKKLGRIVEYESHFDRFRNKVANGWKERKELPGSGILFDLGSHLIDQALVLFGPPKEIFAHFMNQRDNAVVEDNFELLLLYDRLKVTLKSGMLIKEKGPNYQVLGTKGSFSKFGVDVQEEDLKKGKKPENEENWGKEPEDLWGTLDLEGQNPEKIQSETGDYRKFYQNIYESITAKAELLVKPEEARNVIKIIELAQKSHSEKRIVPWE